MKQEHSSRDFPTMDEEGVYYTPSIAPLPRYDTFWRRVGAGIADGVILFPLHWLDSWIFGSGTTPVILLLWFTFNSFSYIIYSVVLHGLYGQTLGKMLTGVRVLDVSETRLSFGQAFLRDSVPMLFTTIGVAIGIQTVLSGENPLAGEEITLADILIGLTAFVWLLAELITMLWNNKRRAIHDYIARSVVVRTR